MTLPQHRRIVSEPERVSIMLHEASILLGSPAHPLFLEVHWSISFSASKEPELSKPAKQVARDFLHDEFDLRSPNLCRHKSHAVHPAAVSLGKPVDSALALAKFQPLD